MYALLALSPRDYNSGQSSGVSMCDAYPHVSMHKSRCFCTCVCVCMSWCLCNSVVYIWVYSVSVYTLPCVLVSVSIPVCWYLCLGAYACLSLRAFICVHACMYAQTYVHTCVPEYEGGSVCTLVCVSINIHLCMCLHMCSCICV